MKTYNVVDPVEATGPHGAFVKTSDYFEAVAEYDREIVELRRQLAIATKRHERAITSMLALAEELRKCDNS